MAAVPFCPRVLDGPRMCGVEGWVGWRTAVLSPWLFGPGGARNCLNRDGRD